MYWKLYILSPKRCVPKKRKDVNVKERNMITNKNETKAVTEHISCNCKCKLINTKRNSK